MRFFRVGSPHAIAVLVRRSPDEQPLYLPCPRCGVDYVGTTAKLQPDHGLKDVWRYPAVQDALDRADERLVGECPDHSYRFEVE